MNQNNHSQQDSESSKSEEDTIQIKNGRADKSELLSLLKTGFDGRTDEHVEWKYHNYPDFNEEHVFVAYDDEKPVASRRLAYKELITDDNTTIPLFVGSDFIVVPEYRNQGLYSSLLMKTNRYEKRSETELSISYNRKGYVTFETKKWMDWEYRPLPLYIRLLSPEVVIPKYASLALEDSRIPSEIVEHPVAERILSISGHFLPNAITTIMVEAASADSSVTSLFRHFRGNRSKDNSIVAISQNQADERINEILHLYDSVREDSELHFRREKNDIQHMLSHPYLEAILIAEKDDRLAGFLPVITIQIDEVTEARALDIVATNTRIFNDLIAQLEQTAADRDIDIISVISNQQPDPKWAKIEKQMLMWDWDGNTTRDPLIENNIEMGFYDVV